MKKIIYTLALFLAIAAFQNSSAQVAKTETSTEIKNDESVSVRQNINRPITQLIVNGKSAVWVVYDTCNYVIANFERNEINPLDEKWVVVKGTTLIIDDPDGDAFYIVFLKKEDLQVVKNTSETPIVYVDVNNNLPSAHGNEGVLDENAMASESHQTTESTGNLVVQQQLDEAHSQLNKARKELANARNEIAKSLIIKHGDKSESHTFVNDTFFVDSTDDLIPLEVITDDMEPSEIVEMEVIETSNSKRKSHNSNWENHYSWEDRAGAAFLWGFNNWGSNWYNGLNKMDGAYELRTSFSSWQLEFTYAVIMTRHFYLDLGIGYESDIYKFSAPLVDMDNNGLLQDRYTSFLNSNYGNYIANNQAFDGTHFDDWSTRLVTRYISIPIDFVFRFDNDFKIGLSAIPALAFSSSHTGLKHEIDTKELEYQDVHNVSKFITPYKLDLRLSMRFDHFGIFAQVATTSLFTDKDVYPFKIGFIIK